MANLDPGFVRTRSVIWNITDKSVHYGDEYIGILRSNQDGLFDCLVQLDGNLNECGSAKTPEAGALKIAYEYWDNHRDEDPPSFDAIEDHENRRSIRFNFAAPVRTTNNAEESLGRSFDLSTCGAALEFDLDLNVDDQVNLDVGDLITLSARVVRKDGNRFGVTFVDCDEQAQRVISSRLEEIDSKRADRESQQT